jgi:hypothetical protein
MKGDEVKMGLMLEEAWLEAMEKVVSLLAESHVGDVERNSCCGLPRSRKRCNANQTMLYALLLV